MALDLTAFGPQVARRVPHGFDDRPYSRFGVVPMGPTIGAQLTGVDLGGPVDDGLLISPAADTNVHWFLLNPPSSCARAELASGIRSSPVSVPPPVQKRSEFQPLPSVLTLPVKVRPFCDSIVSDP